MSDDKKQQLEAEIREYVGKAIGPAAVARDLVNQPMIRQWCEAMGDADPVYTDEKAAEKSIHDGIVAPPTMLQAWILKGYEMALETEPEDLQEKLHALFDAYGYTGVIATNCEQGYTRYLRPGDRVSSMMTIEAISEEKATAVGVGYFVETRTTFLDQKEEEVGWMTFRVLKFKPQEGERAVVSGDDESPPLPGRIRPPLSQDVGWWWQDGIEQGKLLIQRCDACGVLRHPPRPICGECQSMEWNHVESTGKGVVHSYVIMHHPPLPGYEMPMAVGLIDLEEGTRVVAGIEGIALDEVEIGMHVECSIEGLDATGFHAPVFRPVK